MFLPLCVTDVLLILAKYGRQMQRLWFCFGAVLWVLVNWELWTASSHWNIVTYRDYVTASPCSHLPWLCYCITMLSLTVIMLLHHHVVTYRDYVTASPCCHRDYVTASPCCRRNYSAGLPCRHLPWIYSYITILSPWLYYCITMLSLTVIMLLHLCIFTVIIWLHHHVVTFRDYITASLCSITHLHRVNNFATYSATQYSQWEHTSCNVRHFFMCSYGNGMHNEKS